MSRVKWSSKQAQFWREANHRWNFKVGATRSGKTYQDFFLIARRIRERRNESGLTVILGNTRETLRRNILIPMQEIYGVNRVTNLRYDNSCFMFGERVFCLGADNINHVDRIRGSSIKYCYGDEVATWHPEVFAMLKSRLDRPMSCFDGALNPQSPSHWLKEFLDSDADIYQQHYTIFDNPFLLQDFVDELCKEYAGTVYYQRYILGEWALAEGLIYPMYQNALAKPPELPENAAKPRMEISIDYGTMNAFAALLWAQYGDCWYCIDEYYYSGRDTGTQKTDEEYARDLDKWLEPLFAGENPQFGEYNKLRVTIDPSAASFIALLRRRGKYHVVPAVNDVADGIRETATCMQTGKIKIDPDLKNIVKELQGYVWDENAADDTPVKVNDHCLSGDTVVITENGGVKISELVGKKGRVWSYNVETQNAELKPFHDVRMTRESADLICITLENGKQIKCTEDHLILTKNGYIEAKYLDESMEIIEISDRT